MSSQDHPYGQEGYPYQPYGAPYGQQPPPNYGDGYGYPPPPKQPNADGPRANAIVALVLNLMATMACCNLLAIPGAILAGLALGKVSTEPESAKRMLVWSWTLFGLGFLLGIGLFLFLGLNGHLDD